ncbi:MAG: hypothetical protein R3345_02655 [Fulvivirga sp.]|nr:hypothetical protein [Fulvivirga sp.]
MELKTLSPQKNRDFSDKTEKQFKNLEKLISEINKHTLADDVVEKVNDEIEKVNDHTGEDKKYRRQIIKSTQRIISVVVKEHKLVPKNYYRNMWLGVGMAAFGVPLGIAFGAALDNMGLMGVGLPLGIAIGYGVGKEKDKKAKEEGKQLDVAIEH